MHVDINGGNVGYLLWALHNQVSIMQRCPLTGWLATDICVIIWTLASIAPLCLYTMLRLPSVKQQCTHACMQTNIRTCYQNSWLHTVRQQSGTRLCNKTFRNI